MRKQSKKMTKKKWGAIVAHIALIIISFIFLFPCLWIILSSFSKSGSLYTFKGFFPKEYALTTYKNLFLDTTEYNYPMWFRNTLFIATTTCILSTFLVILTAYTFSKFQFKTKKAMMKTTMVLGMFPSFMGMIAIYILMTQFNLVNHMWGLILFYSAVAPMGYLTQKGFFDTLPSAVDEAARIDGATNFQIFWKINMPMSKPILVYTALASFTTPWSDYILPKLLLKEKNLYTVAIGLMSLDENEFARFAAGSVVIAVPIVILYMILSKHIIAGLSYGATKG